MFLMRDEIVVDVIIDTEAPDLESSYSYILDPNICQEPVIGHTVFVNFANRETIGYISAIHADLPEQLDFKNLKRVIRVIQDVPAFTQEQLVLASWISETYICRMIDAIRCVAPSILTAKIAIVSQLTSPHSDLSGMALTVQQAHIVLTLGNAGGELPIDELRRRCRLPSFNSVYPSLVRKKLIFETRRIERAQVVGKTVRGVALAALVTDMTGISPAGKRILEFLENQQKEGHKAVPIERLLKMVQISPSAVKTLVSRGFISTCDIPVPRRTFESITTLSKPPILTSGQKGATSWVAKSLRPDSVGPSTALLFGVTASGKTEVYLDAISQALQKNKTSIMLLPEIALTSQVVEIFTRRFGDKVAILHSRLSEGERHDEWRRLQSGAAQIAIGARSAAFAPVTDLGLVIIDEEHESSYKQDSQPRYHTRDVVRQRAANSGAMTLLGSATPSVETYYQTEQGKIARLEMPERIDSRPLPTINIVDMREELRFNRSLFSTRMVDELRTRLDQGRQSILFLNRRGYSQFILCRDCGYSAKCPNCEVSLTFHATVGRLKCHHCGHNQIVPNRCPDCSSTHIRGFGVGTEKVEEEALRHFPSARVLRMDRDTTARKGGHESILKAFRNGEADILIGTQMVAKGLDFPDVTFVGVISADTSINVPDFRASERTFQLLTQVSGRAGRGEHPGSVVIQAFTPDHIGLTCAATNDYGKFYRSEISFREKVGYPPFRNLANVVISDPTDLGAKSLAQMLHAKLKGNLPNDFEILGPNSAPLSRVKQLFRYHIVIKSPPDVSISSPLRTILSQLSATERRHISIDIDPYNLS